jgi:hypothetical protein
MLGTKKLDRTTKKDHHNEGHPEQLNALCPIWQSVRGEYRTLIGVEKIN